MTRRMPHPLWRWVWGSNMITGIITRDEIIGMMIGVMNAGIMRIIMIDGDRGTFLSSTV